MSPKLNIYLTKNQGQPMGEQEWMQRGKWATPDTATGIKMGTLLYCIPATDVVHNSKG